MSDQIKFQPLKGFVEKTISSIFVADGKLIIEFVSGEKLAITTTSGHLNLDYCTAPLTRLPALQFEDRTDDEIVEDFAKQGITMKIEPE